MKVLLVGAGAVGQVYGLCLQRGGAEVAFLVKPKYADDARAGFVLYELSSRDRRDPIRWDAFDVYTSNDEVAKVEWDYVILCVSSTALRGSDWLAELAPAIAGATVVVLQPGIEDRSFVCLTLGLATDRVISGLIGLCSYAAPLPGEEVPEPGTGFWMPSFMKCPMSGPAPQTGALVDALRAGGMPARVQRDVATQSAFMTPVLQCHIAALEIAGWNIDAMRRDRALMRTANRAMKQAMHIAGAVTGKRPPRLPRLAGPRLLGFAMGFAARRAPMDLATFFRVHYTKVRDQSRALFARWIELGHEHGRDASALAELYARLSD